MKVDEESGVWVKCTNGSAGVLHLSVVPVIDERGVSADGVVRKFEPRLYEIELAHKQNDFREGTGTRDIIELLAPSSFVSKVSKRSGTSMYSFQKIIT